MSDENLNQRRRFRRRSRLELRQILYGSNQPQAEQQPQQQQQRWQQQRMQEYLERRPSIDSNTRNIFRDADVGNNNSNHNNNRNENNNNNDNNNLRHWNTSPFTLQAGRNIEAQVAEAARAAQATQAAQAAQRARDVRSRLFEDGYVERRYDHDWVESRQATPPIQAMQAMQHPFPLSKIFDSDVYNDQNDFYINQISKRKKFQRVIKRKIENKLNDTTMKSKISKTSKTSKTGKNLLSCKDSIGVQMGKEMAMIMEQSPLFGAPNKKTGLQESGDNSSDNGDDDPENHEHDEHDEHELNQKEDKHNEQKDEKDETEKGKEKEKENSGKINGDDDYHDDDDDDDGGTTDPDMPELRSDSSVSC